mgnify:CR=1 FL=1
MTDTITCWPAPAKLNLFLHITGRRPDGYHELQTLFQLLDWGDEIQISIRPEPSIRRINEIEGIPGGEDLAVRAAQLLQKTCDCHLGADIRLIKNIPVGSGLGGGSSDAATVLHALNHLWGCGLSMDLLAELGLELGADVPVFVRGYSAWAEGIGEQLQSFETGDPWYVLLFPDTAISTAELFGHPGLERNSPSIRPSEYSWSGTENAFQSIAADRYPELGDAIEALSKWGSPRLTGTGSCIFLPINEKNDALGITNELKSRYNVRAVRGVSCSPLLAKLPDVN